MHGEYENTLIISLVRYSSSHWKSLENGDLVKCLFHTLFKINIRAVQNSTKLQCNQRSVEAESDEQYGV